MSQASAASIRDRVRDFVRENFLYTRPDFELRDDDFLLERGIVDSMGVIELVEFLQERFEIQVGDEDITEENLGSIDSIARYVAEKRNGTPKTVS